MDNRPELEAEVRALRKSLGQLEAEIAYQDSRRSAVGNRWLREWLEGARKAAREAAGTEAGHVPAAERKKRAFRSFL